MPGVISIRPTKEIEKRLKKIERLEHMEKSALVRKLLLKGAEEELKQQALELFREKKVSVGKAAEIAGLSVYEILNLIRQKGIYLHIEREEIEEDLKAARL